MNYIKANEKFNHFYLIHRGRFLKLLWVNRMGKFYIFDFKSSDFVLDDIQEWYFYKEIIVDESSNMDKLSLTAKKAYQKNEIKEFLESLTIPFQVIWAIIYLMTPYYMKNKLRKFFRKVL